MPHALTPALLGLVAERFKALGEPARLAILNALRQGERSVTELIAETHLGQTTTSKHLHYLHNVGLVARRRAGMFVYYAIADERLYALCDLMCDQLQREALLRQRAVQ